MEPPSTSSPQARRLWQYSSLMTMITQAKIQRSRVRVPSSIRVNRRRFMSRLQLIANLSGTKSRRNFRLFIICKSSVFTIETTLWNSHLPRFRIGDRNRLLGLDDYPGHWKPRTFYQRSLPSFEICIINSMAIRGLVLDSEKELFECSPQEHEVIG